MSLLYALRTIPVWSPVPNTDLWPVTRLASHPIIAQTGESLSTDTTSSEPLLNTLYRMNPRNYTKIRNVARDFTKLNKATV